MAQGAAEPQSSPKFDTTRLAVYSLYCSKMVVSYG